ncbi:hypothetical protein JOC70_002580 [Clostridium pascui]|uniref:hypothetical protein n=1 Tax=Clostridium pascui TaxID=46609 RepID=UPI001959893D|nr:hypothetical protein [Clostridium pascui]MBM7871082.1 hypothetical protein [Clostridium pascui]
MIIDKVKSCMIGESIFKIGDYTTLAEGWGRYKDKLTIEEGINLKIVDIYSIKEEGTLPQFEALVKTNKGNMLKIKVEDLNDVRSTRENHEELNKVGYDFKEGCIYCKGYEEEDGNWRFFNIGAKSIEEHNM